MKFAGEIILLTPKAKKDILNLKREDVKLSGKLWELILSILENPFDGIGKPEPLKGDLQGWWSRQISKKHRIIYKTEDNVLKIASCYGHYDDK